MSQKQNTFFIGKVLHHCHELHSTNEFALDLIAKNNPIEGTVVTADFQTAGRGQLNNSWESAAGQNLLISIILFPHFLTPKHQFILNQVVSLGLNDCVGQFVSKKVTIKWSNDCYIENKKVAGVLIQNSLTSKMIQSSVIGIGLNVNQQLFTSNAPNPTSFSLEMNQQFELANIRDTLCYFIEKWYLKLKAGHRDLIQKKYIESLYLYQKNTLYRDTNGVVFNGVVQGVDDIGRLLIQTNQGLKRYSFKEVQFLHG